MSDSTKDRLISSAERLFAERGVQGASLREVTQASGSKNAMALQYHFQDRAGVIRAILDKHEPTVEARRHAILDEYEAREEADIRALGAALIRPLAVKLSDEDGGPSYLRVVADLYNRPHPDLSREVRENPSNSLYRWRQLATPLLDPIAVDLHRRYSALHYAVNELANRAADEKPDTPLFTSHLIDVVTGILTAPVSDETRRAYAKRAKAASQAADEKTTKEGSRRT